MLSAAKGDDGTKLREWPASSRDISVGCRTIDERSVRLIDSKRVWVVAQAGDKLLE